jgi:hypothetical protein
MWFEYRVVGRGWAEAGVGDPDSNASLSASYIQDALGDLLYAVWRLLEGEAEARCSWQEEPGEYRWIMRRDADLLSLRVLEFADSYPPAEDHAGSVVFETRQEVLTFARAIALGASRTLQQLGEAGYQELWGAPFPTRTLELIKTHLRAKQVTFGDAD